jgi:hypothetical protein
VGVYSGADAEGTTRQPQEDPIFEMIGVDDVEPVNVDDVVYGESITKQFGVLVARSGERIGNLKSLLTAHRIAHLFLTSWPELAPLVLVDSAHQDTWTVKFGDCSPLYCDVALSYAAYLSDSSTNSGLPVRAPAALPIRPIDSVIDLAP